VETKQTKAQAWTRRLLDLVAGLYGLFLILSYALWDADIDLAIAGVPILALSLRFLFFLFISSVHSVAFRKRINRLEALLTSQEEGERLSDLDYRGRNDTLVDVFRDMKWVRLPSVVLVEADIVRLKPGELLPCRARGIKGRGEGVVLQPFATFEDSDPCTLIQRKAYSYFLLLETPLERLLSSYKSQLGRKRTVNSTLFQVAARACHWAILLYTLCLLLIFLGASLGWTFSQSISPLSLLSSPSLVVTAEAMVTLPTLYEGILGWGSAYMHCLAEVMDKLDLPTHIPRPKQHIVSYLEVANPEHKAEAEFDDLDLKELFPQVHFSRKLYTFLHCAGEASQVIDTFSSVTGTL